MRLKLVPPRQGMAWVRQGLHVFFQRPIAFCALFFIYVFIGPMLMMAVAPLASVGFMIATRQALDGRFPFASVFIEPLQGPASRRWAQIQLGLAYALAVALVFWVADAVGGAAFDALRQAIGEGKSTPEELQPLLSDSSLQFGWFLLAGGIALLAIPFWHAPALVHWDGQTAIKALFFSTVACWRNKGALTVYVLAWGTVILVFAFVMTMLFALMGMPQAAFVASTPAVLMLSAAFYASLYFTFADSFEASPDAASLPPAQETA